MKTLIVSFLIGCLYVSSLTACTAFCMRCGEKWILAKNLDWPVDNGFIFINNPGTRKSAFCEGPEELTWESRYRSITFNQFGKEFPLGGMNSRGLVVEELNMPRCLPVPDRICMQVNEFQLVQYLLDCCASVEEVVTAIRQIQVVPALVSLHYLVMDRWGNSLILEPDEHQIQLYRIGDSCLITEGRELSFLPVLSNNRYMESLGYLARFQGFGGDLSIRHRPGSNDRFVSVASILSESGSEGSIHSAFAVLDTVSQHDTRWSIVYDPSQLEIYFKFHGCSYTCRFALHGMKRKDLSIVYAAKAQLCDEHRSVGFRSIGKEENGKAIRSVLNLLQSELHLTDRKEYFERWISFSNSFIPYTARKSNPLH